MDKKPSQALLISMALRVDNGFGMLPKSKQEAMLRDMERCWEEVVGQGFYKPERDGFYLSMLRPEHAPEFESWDYDRRGLEK